VGVHAASGEEQIADKGIAQIAFEAWNSTEARNEAEAEFRKSEARHFIGNNNVADKSQFEASAKTNSMNSGNGYERCVVNKIQNFVDAFQKSPYTARRSFSESAAAP